MVWIYAYGVDFAITLINFMIKTEQITLTY